jgi:ribose/xylose/arabinose/galactoside ABC-type transport system permease subunit
MNNGLILIKASIYFQETFFGLLILMAIGIDRIREIYRG